MTDETLHELDVRRQLCPIPVIKTQNKVAELAQGEVLRVTCTDPGALNDIPAWCRINGHEVLATEEGDLEVVITLRVGEPSVALYWCTNTKKAPVWCMISEYKRADRA